MERLRSMKGLNNVKNNGELIERLAESVHEIFCEEMKSKGYTWGPVNDDKKKQHSSLVDFSELPEDEKEQNRGNVRDIWNKLKRVNYIIVPARRGETTVEFTDGEVEKLAEEEHERWMKQKLAGGWRYAARTDKTRKVHGGLVPWKELPENEKEKDRFLIRGIPHILEKAGCRMGKA